MASVIVEHSCSLSRAICNVLRIVIIIIILSLKLANDAIYRPCLDISTFHDKAEKLIWTMFFFDCQLKLSYQTICMYKTSSNCSGFNTDYGSSEPLKTLVMLCYVIHYPPNQYTQHLQMKTY